MVFVLNFERELCFMIEKCRSHRDCFYLSGPYVNYYYVYNSNYIFVMFHQGGDCIKVAFPEKRALLGEQYILTFQGQRQRHVCASRITSRYTLEAKIPGTHPPL